MFEFKVNKRLLPVKMHYFLHLASAGPMVGFIPTLSRQLGYSISAFGNMMTFLSIVTMIICPTVGIIVDKFNIKKKLLLTSMTLYGVVVAFLFMYAPKINPDTAVELKCDSSKNVFIIHSENVLQRAQNESILIDENIYTCRLHCQDTTLYQNEVNESNNQSNLNGWWMNTNSTNNPNYHKIIDIDFKLKDIKQHENSYIFNIPSVQINGTQIPSTTCQWHLNTFCHNINCSNDAITELVVVKTYRGNLLYLYQFWIFFFLLIGYYSFTLTTDVLFNPICLDLLGENTEDYGKQKLWASIGWGGFSIFIGWIVDKISVNSQEKNYSPVFYSSILLTLCNLVVTNKIKISESKKTEGKLKSTYGLFSKHYVIAFYLWSTVNTFFHSIITIFLFWYMEDLVSGNNDQSQRKWLKTLQGLAQGIQCFGGEIPFFFWSGWIIRKMGHINSMALTLASMAVRMYLYTVISNPAWIILIELLNGLSFALAISVKMSYAKLMSPPDTTNTIIGFMGLFDRIGDILAGLLGGYIFDSYGGLWSFRFFAYCSALMFLFNLVCNHFGILKELKNNNFIAVSTKIENNDNVKPHEELIIKN